MAEKSNIEWTDATFNPWVGCTKISPACDNCYAADWAKRFGDVEWGDNPRRRTGEKNWNQPRKWNRQADAWEAEHGRPRFVFCASLADVFDNQVDPAWRADLWKLIKECDRLVWLLLTKRPQNIAKMLPADWGAGYPNVWLGTTVENQEVADRNIWPLFSVPAAKRFLSIEPIVGPINLENLDVNGDATFDALEAPTWQVLEKEWMGTSDTWEEDFEDWYGHPPGEKDGPAHPTIDWVITGGESGPNARPAPADWYRSIRDQCKAAGVPFHFKQWGEFNADEVRVGKKEAGRLLDGRTWDDRPAA